MGGGPPGWEFGRPNGGPSVLLSAPKLCQKDQLVEESKLVGKPHFSGVLWSGKMIGAWDARASHHALPLALERAGAWKGKKFGKNSKKYRKLFYGSLCKKFWCLSSRCLDFCIKQARFTWKRNIRVSSVIFPWNSLDIMNFFGKKFEKIVSRVFIRIFKRKNGRKWRKNERNWNIEIFSD